jgi:hypothetical protein
VTTTTTITLPAQLAQKLQQRADAERLSPERLAIAYIQAGLAEGEGHQPEPPADLLEPDPELLALIEHIKAMPRDPANIIPAKGNLAEALRALEAVEPDPDYDLDAEIAALDAAEAELRAINKADDIAEGRG